MQTVLIMSNRRELIETLGVHLESDYGLPPLAARIYADLVLTDDQGLTFEDCQSNHAASKGSVSTALNLLQKMGIVAYYTRPGERKRRFTIAARKTFFRSKLEEQQKKLEKDRAIIEMVNNFNKQHNKEHYLRYGQRTELYLDFLDQSEKLVRSSLEQFKKHTESREQSANQ